MHNINVQCNVPQQFFVVHPFAVSVSMATPLCHTLTSAAMKRCIDGTPRRQGTQPHAYYHHQLYIEINFIFSERAKLYHMNKNNSFRNFKLLT